MSFSSNNQNKNANEEQNLTDSPKACPWMLQYTPGQRAEGLLALMKDLNTLPTWLSRKGTNTQIGWQPLETPVGKIGQD